MPSFENITLLAGTAEASTVGSSPVSKPLARSSPRDAALDITKGLCVIVMVLYHTINYFPRSPLTLNFLFFVTGAFILLAGFVTTNIYLGKHDSRKEWPFISRRLASRGIKLVLLALALNVAIMATGAQWKQKGDLTSVISNLLLGSDHRSVSFYLLVIIGYSLSFTAILLALGKGRPVLLVPAALACLIYGTLAGFWEWPGGYYVRLLALGQVGAALGLIQRSNLIKFGARLDVVLVLYFAHVFAMILWPPSYPLYVLHVICTTLAMYCLGMKCDSGTWICRKVTLLGNYSLLAYLFQIAFLQVLRRLIPFSDQGVLVAFLLCCGATLLCVELVHGLNARSKLLRSAYAIVFR